MHLALLLLLGYWFSTKPSQLGDSPMRRGQIVLAQVSENVTIYESQSDVENSSSTKKSKSPVAQELPPALPRFDSPDLELAGQTPVEASIDVGAMANVKTDGAGFEFKLSDSDLASIESDRKHFKSIEAVGPETTIKLFGSGDLTGRKFVFLIDRSKSMGDQGLRVLRQATSELVTAINQLKENHFFQIVAYNDHITAIQKRGLLRATEENKSRVPVFMTNLLAYGGTNHQSAFYSALAFKPDVIVVLNDGGFPELNDGQIAEMGRLSGRTEIHALHFGLGPPSTKNHFMQEVARTCSGTYRYIDVRKWREKQVR